VFLPNQKFKPQRRGLKLSTAHHWSEIILEIRHQFHTSIHQSEFKSISKRQFETSEVMRILNIRRVISRL
jgi:hypothetical protein